MSGNIIFVLIYHGQKLSDLSHIVILFVLVVKRHKQNVSAKEICVTVKNASY